MQRAWLEALICLLLMVVPTLETKSAEQTDLEIAPSLSLELFLAHRYPALWHHRAIAIGPAGVFATAFRAGSDEKAADQALHKCREKLMWHPITAARSMNCELYATGERIVWQKKTAQSPNTEHKLDWQSPPPPDPSVVVLHIRDCRAPASDPTWKQTWFDYFALNAIAVAVLKMPTQTSQSCPTEAWRKDASLRAARNATRNAISALAKSYPEATIMVWLDGSAGNIAHVLNSRLPKKIITTNAACAYQSSNQTLLPDDVPVLAILSRKDNSLASLARNAGMQDISIHCRNVAQKRPMTTVLVTNTKQAFPIWRPDIMAALQATLNTPPAKLSPGDPRQLATLPYEAHLEFNRVFRMFEHHRAFIISSEGKSFFGTGHGSTAEALRAALWHCNRSRLGNGFKQDGKCLTFALEDEVVLGNSDREREILAATSPPH